MGQELLVLCVKHVVCIVLNCFSQIASLIQNGVLNCCYPNDKFLSYARIVSENMQLAAIVCWNFMCMAHCACNINIKISSIAISIQMLP